MSAEAPTAGGLQVLVVGAGPVGLATAAYLRRAGLAVRVVEKRSGPSEHSKAIGLQHRSSLDGDRLVHACERLGIRACSITDIEGRDLRPWALTDLYGDFARLYGGTRELMMVIRPDGHVGLALPRIDRSVLARYLRLLCAPALVDESILGAVR